MGPAGLPNRPIGPACALSRLGYERAVAKPRLLVVALGGAVVGTGIAVAYRRVTSKPRTVERAVTIDRPASELEALWRDPDARRDFAADPADLGKPVYAAAPSGRGTEIRLRVEHGSDLQARETLRRFKRLAEAGEVPTTDGQPSGRRSSLAGLVGGRHERTP